MADGLPYFKFVVSSWISGKITLEKMDVQGLFINICALYWQRSGALSLSETKRRLSEVKPTAFKSLLKSGLVVVKNDKLQIAFLDDQLKEIQNKSLVNSANGRLGGRPTKPTALVSLTEPKGIREDKRRVEKKRILTDPKAFAKIFNKPYSEERGMSGAGQDVDMILAQLDGTKDWLPHAKALRQVYDAEGWSLPTNPATIVNSLIGTDWVERMKDANPERKAERKLNTKLDGTGELPKLAPANRPGALDI